MSEFIVLGLVPGTQMQITFILWVCIAISIAIGVTLYRTRLFQAWLIATSIFVVTQRSQLR